MLDAAKGGLKFLEGLARIAKPVVWLMVLIGAIAAYVKNGQWPTP